MITTTNNFNKLIDSITEIRDQVRNEQALRNERSFETFYANVISYFSDPTRGISHTNLEYGVDRNEPDIPLKRFVIKRGRPSLRIHKTTIGDNFDQLNETVTQAGDTINYEASIDNMAPHALFYFEDMPAHTIPTNLAGSLYYHTGPPLPWGSRPTKFYNLPYVDHPGSEGKRTLLPLLYEKERVSVEQRLHRAIQTIAFGALDPLFNE